MTPDPRFLALVAKVDEAEEIVRYFVDTYGEMAQSSERFLFFPFHALKGEIMRHEPEDYYGTLVCKTCLSFDLDPYEASGAPFPCKPFLDMEAEVGK